MLWRYLFFLGIFLLFWEEMQERCGILEETGGASKILGITIHFVGDFLLSLSVLWICKDVD